jgi:isopentenyl-diphosphate Delta-isomerase
MADETFVILVNTDDHEIGIMEKMEAHRKALLHRAISVFVFNRKGDWLLQRRAIDKYHSQGLWTNTCCSHPFPGESVKDAAKRRLLEEMGMVCDLDELFTFTYMEKLDEGLTEHEFDHVFFGTSDMFPDVNAEEVMEWKYISFIDLLEDITLHPLKYTIWFRLIFEKVNHFITNHLFE